MGRKSRLKRERREAEETGINGVMREISQDSMQSLLEAASASPTSNYVLPSIATAFCSFVQQRRHGEMLARPDHVARLVEVAHNKCGDLAPMEGFYPGDPQEEALVRWAGSLHRILPGTLSQPVSLLEEARRLTYVIDPVLNGAIGYGLSDAIELVLRRVSHVANTLAPEWTPGGRRDISAPPSISQRELSAAGSLSSIESQVKECRHPSRAQKALDRHSVPMRRICYDTDGDTLGPVMAVSARGMTMPLPAGLLMNTIPQLMNTLSQKARELEASLSSQWAAQVAKTLVRMLDGPGHRVIAVQPDRDGNPNLLVVRYSSQQILLLGIAASLDGQIMQQLLDATNIGFAGRNSVAVPPALRGSVGIDPGAQPESMQIVACPTDPLLLSRGRVREVTLQDILWMHRTAEDPSDLWRYARDIREVRETSEIFAFDEADAWQWWSKNNKSFYNGGLEMPVLSIAPGIQLDEWDMAANFSAVERALLLLDLPEASAWPILEDYETTWYAKDAVAGCRYGIILGEVPVALGWGEGASNGEYALALLVDGLLSKLERINERLRGWLVEEGHDALRVDFVMGGDHVGPVVEFGSISGSTLTLHWQKSLQARLMTDAASVEEAVGAALANGAVSRDRMPDFIDAWSQTPRAVRMGAIHSPQRATPSERPVTIGVAGNNWITRELAVYMRKCGIECREYAGDEAKHLDSQVIYPWLINRLCEELARYSPKEILAYALEQLEMLNYERHLIDRKTELFLGFKERSEIGDQHFHDSRNEIVLHTKYVSLIIEQLVASPPSGSTLPGRARMGVHPQHCGCLRRIWLPQ